MSEARMSTPGSGMDLVIAKLAERYPGRRLLVFAVVKGSLGVALFELADRSWGTWLVNFEREPYTFGGIYFRPDNGGVDAAFRDFAERLRATARKQDERVEPVSEQEGGTMGRHGVSLATLLVTLVAFGTLSAGMRLSLATFEGTVAAATLRMNPQQALRTAASILPAELKRLDARRGDILSMSPRAVTLRSPRDGVAAAGYRQTTYGAFQDRGGRWYVGLRDSAPTIQSVVGPLANGNALTLSYYDERGAVTADPARVAQIGVTVRARTALPVEPPATGLAWRMDSLTARVALRNTPRASGGPSHATP